MTRTRDDLEDNEHELDGIPTDVATVKALDKAHVFHSWSAQGLIDPLPIASAQGSYFTDYEGKSLSRLLLAAGERQHRLPAPEADRGDPGVRRDR